MICRNLVLIGITQKAIGTTVVDEDNKVLGSTNIGLTWGISNYLLYNMVTRMIKLMRTQENEDGTIKKNLTQKDLDAKIHVHIKKGKLTDQ